MFEETVPNVERRRVVVFGASGHGKVVLDILRRQATVEVIGLLDNFKPIGCDCGGYLVIGSLEDLPVLTIKHPGLGIAIGIGDNWTRARIASQIRMLCPAIEYVTAIHPSAEIASDVSVGAGTVVMAGAVINPGARIGELCIVNTRASLDHDSVMDQFSSLGPAATTGGSVRLGAYSNIGIGATVIQEISIGKHTVIGAGAVVFRSIPDQVVAYGTPARIIRQRAIGERYLGDLSNGPNGK
jgi:sugar O-acyltransferase (sialic acid O-acetyltransferase NeuD family)